MELPPTDAPVAMVAQDAVKFDSLEKALEAALRESAALASKDRHEYGGMALKGPEGYVYTAPVSSGSSHKVEYRLRIPKGYTKEAMYHVHPPEENGLSQFFSPADIDMVKKLGIASYIVDMSEKKVHLLRPEDTKSKKKAKTGTPVDGITLN